MPANTSPSNPLLSKISSLNPFGRQGFVQLPTNEAPGAPLPAPSRREEEEGWFARESPWRMTVHFAPDTNQVTEHSGANILTFVYASKPMGPPVDLWRLQSGCSGVLCDLFCESPYAVDSNLFLAVMHVR